MVQQVNDSNFEEIVNKAKMPVVVDFSAAWCGPCQQMSIYIDELAAKYDGKVLFCKCDVDESQEAPMNFGVRNIPAVFYVKDGQVTKKTVGAVKKSEMEAAIEAML